MNKKVSVMMVACFLSTLPIELVAMPHDAFADDSGDERGRSARRRAVHADQFRNDSGDENNPRSPYQTDSQGYASSSAPSSSHDIGVNLPYDDSRDYIPSSRPRRQEPFFVPVVHERVREVPVFVPTLSLPRYYRVQPIKFKHFLATTLAVTALMWLLSSDEGDVRY